MNKRKLNKELIIRNIKILNIGWATVAYFFISIILIFMLDKVFDKLFDKYDEEEYEKRSDSEILFEFIIYIWTIGVIIYVIRNLFPLVPFIFDGYMGYNHNRVKEVTNATMFSIFIVTFNKRLQGYYNILKKRIFKF
jgi:hypothetical protein